MHISSSEVEALGVRLAEQLEGSPGRLPELARRRLLTALVRDYAHSPSPEGQPPIEASGLTADEVAVTVAAMMRAMDITSFELAALFNV